MLLLFHIDRPPFCFARFWVYFLFSFSVLMFSLSFYLKLTLKCRPLFFSLALCQIIK